MATVLFLHGWTSTPGGLKPTYLAEHGHIVINPALPDEDFSESVRIAQAEVGCTPTVTPYWSVRAAVEQGTTNPFTGSEAEALAHLDTFLRDAVKIRSHADADFDARKHGVGLLEGHQTRAHPQLDISVRESWQGTLHKFAVNQFRFALELGGKILLRRDEGLARHLSEA